MKAQGATEYLVLMSVVLGIALICITLLVWPTGTTKDVKTSQSDIKCGIAKNAVPDIMQGMVAYYKFDEGSGTLSYDRKTGTSGDLSGASWAIGKSNSALSFDGVDDYISVSDSTSMRLVGGGTISAWIYPLSKGEPGAIVDKSTDSSGNNGYRFAFSNAYDRLYFRTNGETVTYMAGNSITYDTWQHVAVTFNGAQRHLYVNGVDVTAAGASEVGLPPNVAGEVRIGNQAGATTSAFNGTIDEILIYNRVLSADEIKYLAQYPGCP